MTSDNKFTGKRVVIRMKYYTSEGIALEETPTQVKVQWDMSIDNIKSTEIMWIDKEFVEIIDTPSSPNDSWMKELQKKGLNIFLPYQGTMYVDYEYIKSFIPTLISLTRTQALQEAIEIVKKSLYKKIEDDSYQTLRFIEQDYLIVQLKNLLTNNT